MSLFKTTPTLRAIALTGLLGAASLGAMAQAEKPQYGGTLNIGMVYVTLSPLSWDPADWAWKFGQDTGLMYEQLFASILVEGVVEAAGHKAYAKTFYTTRCKLLWRMLRLVFTGSSVAFRSRQSLSLPKAQATYR